MFKKERKDKYKTKEQLIKELAKLRKRLSDLQTSGNGHKRTTQFEAVNKKLKDEITAHKLSEEKILKEKNFTQTIIDSLSATFFIFDSTGKMLQWNKTAESVTGYSPDEIARMEPLDFIAEEDRGLVQKRIEEVFVKGTAGVEANYLTKGGEKIPYYFTGVRIMIDGVPGLAGIGIDISDRKRIEEALKKSEAHYRSLVETSPYSIVVADLTGRITFCNRQTLYMHGFKNMEEIIGMSCFDLFAPECRQRAADAAQQTLINGGFRNVEYTLIRKDGSRFPAEASASLIVDKEGKTQGFVGVLWDITERKLKENEIKIRADQNAAIAELGRLALAYTDLSVLMDETVKLVAKNLDVEYSKVLELLPDGSFLLRAGIGWKDGLVGTAIVGGKIESQAGYTLLSHKPVIVEDFNTETRFHKPSLLQENGVVSGMSIIIGKQDKPIGVLGAHTSKPRTFTRDDINFLESMANILAEAIYQKQFEEIKKELEKMRRIESIGVLAGGIAHDFNNLLTIIMGNIFIAKRELSKSNPPDNNKILKMLTDSEEGCKNARDLSNMLITFSKGEMLMRKLISISELLKETTNLLLSKSKNIICEFSLPDNLYVMADKFQINQVIKGIVANAIEAMPDGGIIRMMAENITISERNNQLLKDGKYLRVSIEDTGPGISKENLSKIFDLYFSTKDKHTQKGLGLGLSICYSIIKKHGGLITVDSKVGAGTTFHIYLPVS